MHISPLARITATTHNCTAITLDVYCNLHHWQSVCFSGWEHLQRRGPRRSCRCRRPALSGAGLRTFLKKKMFLLAIDIQLMIRWDNNAVFWKRRRIQFKVLSLSCTMNNDIAYLWNWQFLSFSPLRQYCSTLPYSSLFGVITYMDVASFEILGFLKLRCFFVFISDMLHFLYRKKFVHTFSYFSC